MIHNLSIQNKQSKPQVTQINKNHRQIRKPDFSINFDKDTILDLENDIEYQKMKQQRLRELKQQLQNEQRAKIQEYEDELQAMVKASNAIIQEAHEVMNANEYVGSKRRIQKTPKIQSLLTETQISPQVTLKQSAPEPPTNTSYESFSGTQKLEPTHILQTRFKLKDLESMKIQFLVIHYHLLKMFDRQFKPYIMQFIQARDIKLEDRVDNIMGRLSKDMEKYILASKLVVKPELIDGYSLSFEGNQPFEAIQTDEFQEFLNVSVKTRIAQYEDVFKTVNQLQQKDSEFKKQRATEIQEHMEELAIVKAPLTKFEPDEMLSSFFQTKCQQYEEKLQKQREQLQQFKQERQEQQRQKMQQQREKQQQLEQQSQQKMYILRENKIHRLDTVNKRNNQIELQKVQALEKERRSLLLQKEKLPAGRQQQQIIARIQKIDETLNEYQQMRNGVKQLYQFNEEMGSLQKAINRFSAFISDPQNTD